MKVTAGLLQVPEKLLKEVEDWMVASYTGSLFYHFEALSKARTSRAENIEVFKARLEKLETVYNNMIKGDFPEEEMTIVLPKFQLRMDDVTHTYGVIDRTNNTMLLSIRKMKTNIKPNPFWFDLEIEPRVSFFSKTPISKVAIIKELQKHKDIIEGVIAASHYFIDSWGMESEDEIKGNEFIKNVCRRFMQKGSPDNIFQIDIKDLPYFRDQNPPIKRLSIKAVFRNEKDPKTNGTWHPLTPTYENPIIGMITVIRDVRDVFTLLKIRPDSALQTLQDSIVDVKRTTRHELQHFMQDAIQYINQSKGAGGLPSYNLRDNPDAPSPENEMKKQPHALRDREFYTRLSDEVHNYNRAKSQLPSSLTKPMLLAWVDQIEPKVFQDLSLAFMKETILKQFPEADFKYTQVTNYKYLKGQAGSIYNTWKFLPREFFKFLKMNQPDKYKKAVAEFLKGIS